MGSGKVALVLDADYGEKLFRLASKMAVWILDSPVNVAAAREIWKRQPQPEHMVTTFKSDSFDGLMDNIELHHATTARLHHFAIWK